MIGSFTFTVPGEPKGKGRPKFARRGKHVRVYTPKETEQAEAAVLDAWKAAGAIRLDGPVRLRIKLVIERPAGHFLTDGISLSAAGRRMPLPSAQKPDVDNAVKLVMDALNSEAWTDDVRVVDVAAKRVWGNVAETVVEAAEVLT